MSDQPPPAEGEETSISQPGPPGPEPVPAWDPAPRAARTTPDRVDQRRPLAIFGGLLAGIGIGIALASLFHIIQLVSPNGYSGIGGTVALVVLLAGPAIGLGLGMMVAALIRDGTPPAHRPPPTG